MQNQPFQQFLIQFYRTQVGQYFLAEEIDLVKKAMQKVFGFHLIQIGLTSQRFLLSEVRTSQKVLVDLFVDQSAHSMKGFDGFVEADLNYLPFKRDSIDVAFLPHTLEGVNDPYHLLRQIDDLLVPEGHLCLTGFNAKGCGLFRQKMGLSKQGLHKEGFAQAHLISPARLVDWLKLLGYDIELVQISPFNCLVTKHPTWRVLRWLEKALSWMGVETGNVYCILAKKRVSSPTPVGLNWKLSNLMPLKKGQAVVPNRRISNEDYKVRKENCKQ